MSSSSSPSRIPLPKSRLPMATPPEEEQPRLANNISRIPKVVATDGAATYRKTKSQSPPLDGSATFVRRLSPPSRLIIAPENSDKITPERRPRQQEWNCHVDIDEQLMQKVEQARRHSATSTANNNSGETRKNRSISPSKIPVASDHRRSSASTSSGCNSGSDSQGSSTRNSPVRHVSPPKSGVRRNSEERIVRERTGFSQEVMEPSPGSRIPLPKSRIVSSNSSPPAKHSSGIPVTVGWSLSPERMLAKENRRITSFSTSHLPAPVKLEDELNQDEEGQGDADIGKRRRNFEAFVMTGDRMIKLAKTPANGDFKSKYSKSNAGHNVIDNAMLTNDQDFIVDMRVPPVARRALVRLSRSEDQLNVDNLVSSLVENDEEVERGSVDALLDTSGVQLLTDNLLPSPPLHSPTGGEVTQCIHITENTPEVKQVINGKQNGYQHTVTKNQWENDDDEIVPAENEVSTNSSPVSKGNRSPVSEDNPNNPPNPILPPPPQSATLSSIVTNSSEEESDLESLHSYHPPAKIIDTPSAIRLAKRLFSLDGFKKTDVSRHLSRNTEYNYVVAEEYLKFFNFTDCTLDMALRRFLSQFCLTGETQERERVLLHFSKRFLECNAKMLGPHMFKSLDAIHTLTCAIMLLNTDLHGENLQRRMTCQEFVENLAGLNDGVHFPDSLLRGIYQGIKDRVIPWADAVDEREALAQGLSATEDEDISRFGNGNTGKTAHGESTNIGKAGGGINPFLNLPDPASAVDYKSGYVMRKSCFDAYGKKTKLGKRSWKMFFLTLRDMVLFCFPDEKAARSERGFEDPNVAIRVHHGLAVRASDYNKKQFVFRLHTADGAEYLFQTSDEKELLTWIEVINYVVACFSAPRLPAPCSNSGGLQRSLLPSSKSKLTPINQLENLEQELARLREDIEAHLQYPPPKGSRKAMVSSYTEKTEYLKFEIMRYETYILTLRTKNPN